MAITAFTEDHFDDLFLPRARTGAADGNDGPADFAAKYWAIEARIASGAFSDWTTFRARWFSTGVPASTNSKQGCPTPSALVLSAAFSRRIKSIT
jgi:hypothetical protein